MDIVSLFKSKTRKELFRLYFTNPEGEYYLRELERMLQIPVSMIHKELLRLEKEGLFVSSKKGNLSYFSLNKLYPIYNELKSIVFKTIGAQGLLREALSRIKDIEIAFIYGSFAKKEEDASSDIDICIVGSIDENSLVREINRLEKILRREINYTIYSKKEFIQKKKQRDGFIYDILKNKKIFLVGGNDDL